MCIRDRLKISKLYAIIGGSIGGCLSWEMTAIKNDIADKKESPKINILKKTKVIISIFAGRAGDTGKDPLPEFIKSLKLAKNFKNVTIIPENKNYEDLILELKKNLV